MKKKILTAVITLVLLAILTFCFCSCNKVQLEVPTEEGIGWEIPDYTQGEIVTLGENVTAASLLADAVDYIVNDAPYYYQQFYTTGDLLKPKNGGGQSRYEVRIKEGDKRAKFESCYSSGLASSFKLERFYFDGTDSFYFYDLKFFKKLDVDAIYSPDFTLAPMDKVTGTQKATDEKDNSGNFSFFYVNSDTCYDKEDSVIYKYNGKYYGKVYIDLSDGKQERVKRRIEQELDGNFVSWDQEAYYIVEFTLENGFYYLTGYQLNDWYSGKSAIKVSLHQTINGTISYSAKKSVIPDDFKV